MSNFSEWVEEVDKKQPWVFLNSEQRLKLELLKEYYNKDKGSLGLTLIGWRKDHPEQSLAEAVERLYQYQEEKGVK